MLKALTVLGVDVVRGCEKRWYDDSRRPVSRLRALEWDDWRIGGTLREDSEAGLGPQFFPERP